MARITEAPPAAERGSRWWLSFALALVLNAGAWLYSYGQLSERVSELQYEVRELRSLVVTHMSQHAALR